MSGITIRASSSRLPRRKRPACHGKSINLYDHCVMLLDIFRTIEFPPGRCAAPSHCLQFGIVIACCEGLIGLYQLGGTPALARGVELGLRQGAGLDDEFAHLVVGVATVIVGPDPTFVSPDAK
jgi:hypothetical protein